MLQETYLARVFMQQLVVELMSSQPQVQRLTTVPPSAVHTDSKLNYQPCTAWWV